MEFPYTHQCFVSSTTLSRNDTLWGKKKGGDDDNDVSSSLSVFRCVLREKTNENFHYTFILWHHEFLLPDCFLLLCYYCLLESFMLMIAQGLLSLISSVTKQNLTAVIRERVFATMLLEFPCDNNLCLTTTTFENKWMKLVLLRFNLNAKRRIFSNLNADGL